MENKKKKINPFLIFFCILMGITVAMCATVAGLWLHGRNALTQTDQAPTIPVDNPGVSSDQGVITYNGKRYRYNQDMCNILLLGIDAEETPDAAQDSHDQADVLVLAALDLGNDRMSLISVPRDILCDFEVLDETETAPACSTPTWLWPMPTVTAGIRAVRSPPTPCPTCFTDSPSTDTALIT